MNSPSRASVAAIVVLAMVVIGLVLFPRLPNETADSEPGTVPLPDFKVLDANDYRLQQMAFESAPLSELVDAINRCNGPRLVIEDDALKRIRISALFRLCDVETVVGMLEQMQMVTVTTRADGTIVLSGLDNP